jgi:alpha-beta hydrolase superfamily lysophospholipase
MSREPADQWNKSIETHEITIESFDGLKLAGTLFLQKNPTDAWMICVHGYMNNQSKLLPQVQAFYKQGVNILTIDLRSHGKSEGVISTMGEQEQEDILAWINTLIAKYPTAKIALLGNSLGAVSCLRAAGNRLPSNVKCIVADSCYNSIFEIVTNASRKISNTSELSNLLISFLKNSKRKTTVEQLKSATLPILFIHSKNDVVSPIDQVNTVFESAPEGKELVITTTPHNRCFDTNPQNYLNWVMSFLEKHGIPPEPTQNPMQRL